MPERNFAVSLSFASILAVLTSACHKSEDQALWWQGERERLELSHDLALKEYRYQQSGYENLGELEKLKVSNQSCKQRVRILADRKAALSGELDSLERQLVGIQENAVRQQRQLAIGRKFKEFSTADGRKFHDVTIATIDDAGVTVRHADGSARLTFSDLDDNQRRFFGLVESASIAAEDQEKREAAAYEQWIDSSLAVTRKKTEEATAVAQRQEQNDRQRRNLLAAQQSSTNSDRALAQPAKPFGGGYSGYYSGVSRSPTYRYIYYYTPESCNSYYGYSPRAYRSTYLNPASNPFKTYSNTPSTP